MRWTYVICAAAVSFAGCDQSYQPDSRKAPRPVDRSATKHDEAPGVSTTDESAKPPGGGQLGSEVDAGNIRLTAPEGWIRRQPRSEFILAEFVLPKAEGDQRDGRLTVSVAGGGIEANVDRWRKQFHGKLDQDSPEEIEVAGLKITLVDLAGTYNDRRGPFAPGVQREGYRMLAAIVPGSGQSHFIKAYGPQKTMASHEQEFRDFLQTIRPGPF